MTTHIIYLIPIIVSVLIANWYRRKYEATKVDLKASEEKLYQIQFGVIEYHKKNTPCTCGPKSIIVCIADAEGKDYCADCFGMIKH